MKMRRRVIVRVDFYFPVTVAVYGSHARHAREFFSLAQGQASDAEHDPFPAKARLIALWCWSVLLTVPTESDAPNAISYADVLVAYGNTIYNKVSVPIAFALGQIETVNTALRKTGDNQIALRLAAITVFHNNTSVSSAGLTSWKNFLAPYKSLLKTDLNIVFTGKGGSFWSGYEYGIADSPGFTSFNAVLDESTVLRHEVAHNAGAKHCGEANDYAQGYKGSRPLMGDFYTILCGNEYQGVYSNPNYSNFYGVIMGSASKGDTARV
ncbi:hypothetical protein [Pseudomonas beijingensis]|uniref:hypothetical protein n=1 Tax=Pseudomonas beijingensis TaxID=2954101 RepID=UPI002733A5D6|nr:hypothetical protein [Pseudomonas sp. FP2262]WLH47278.1 hypothetical protein PSH83_04970 [Pseudomonas sp. FP2262]